MNLTYLKYAVEVAKYGGMNKAAEKLLIQQSNLSRAIRELEKDVGITIFERSSKGVKVTPKGDEFLRHAKSLLSQMNELENLCKDSADNSINFSISVPRASYVCEAFLELSSSLDDKQAKLCYKEGNSIRTIESVIDGSSSLGIIRSERNYDKYFFDYIATKGISSMIIGEYRYMVNVGCGSVLAGLDKVTYEDLRSLTQIAFADPYVPYVSTDTVIENETVGGIKHNIFVVEAMSSCYMLQMDPKTFMWRSPITPSSLDKFGLMQKDCTDHRNIHSDILIWRTNYKFSDTDKYFIEAVKRKAEECGMKVHR